jgi:hypothetical protein
MDGKTATENAHTINPTDKDIFIPSLLWLPISSLGKNFRDIKVYPNVIEYRLKSKPSGKLYQPRKCSTCLSANSCFNFDLQAILPIFCTVGLKANKIT